ncbi:MAG: hypothetical protein WCO98_08470 [bacterium]
MSVNSLDYRSCIPVIGEYDVVVCGGCPAGCVAAMCAQGDTQPNTLDFADLEPRLLALSQNIIIQKNKEWVTPPAI